MRGVLIGLAVLISVVAIGFGVLLLMADGMVPEPGEVRIDVTDQLAQ